MIVTPQCAVGHYGVTNVNPQVLRDVHDGKFHVPLHKNMRVVCMDGRPSAQGPITGIAMPGGSLCVLAAAAYAHASQVDLQVHDDSFAVDTQTIREARAFCAENLAVCTVHTAGDFDPTTMEPTGRWTHSGCAAIDALKTLSDLLESHEKDICLLGQQLGLPVLPQRVPTPFYAGAALLELFRGSGTPCVHLTGAHREQLVIINTRTNTVLDRAQLERAYPGVQAFSLDVWALRQIAHIGDLTAHVPPDVEQLVLDSTHGALNAFCCAAVLALCQPGTPIIVL